MTERHHHVSENHQHGHHRENDHQTVAEKTAFRLLADSHGHAQVRRDDDNRITRIANGLGTSHDKHVFGLEYTGAGTTPDTINEKTFKTTLVKQPDPDATWLRYKDGKHSAPTRFDGDIKVDNKGTVSYLGDHGSYVDHKGLAHKFDAQDTMFQANGAVVQKDTIEGKKFVSKVCKNGAIAEFSYDSQGQPFSVQMSYKDAHNKEHSFWYVKGTDDKWYRNEPGKDDVLAGISKIERVDDSGKVMIKFAGHNSHNEVFGG